MKECPKCGKKFNWWQRAISEDREHARYCCHAKKPKDQLTLAATCRGCPAGCFDGVYTEKTSDPPAGRQAGSEDEK